MRQSVAYSGFEDADRTGGCFFFKSLVNDERAIRDFTARNHIARSEENGSTNGAGRVARHVATHSPGRQWNAFGNASLKSVVKLGT